MRFTLKTDRWYACELIGDEFADTSDKCSYSPIKVLRITPLHSGSRTFRLHFYHANYPEGVRDNQYTLQTVERGETFILAKSLDHDPPRYLQIYDIDRDWMERHFPEFPVEGDVQDYLDRHA